MHEMNVIGNLAASVVQWGQANRVRKILEIDIICGQLRMFDRDFMQRYFHPRHLCRRRKAGVERAPYWLSLQCLRIRL